jgi:hypothetical protein
MKPAMLKEKIELTLNPLVNTRIVDIGRAHTIEWIIFSPLGLSEPTKDNALSISEYSLNIQCTWRILGPEGIVVASDDLYFPPGENLYQDLENFDWTAQGSNRCDERTSLFLKNNV